MTGVQTCALPISKPGKAPVPKTTPKTPGKTPGRALDAAELGASALDAVKTSSDSAAAQATADKPSGALLRDKPGVRTSSSWEKRPKEDPILRSREKTAEIKQLQSVKENKMSDLRDMINEGYDSMSISINGRQVTLNTSMAKRILEVYDSVNTKNKKIVESMLNEDLESFKKLLNFSIKQ